MEEKNAITRRNFIKSMIGAVSAGSITGCNTDWIEEFASKNFQEMTPEQITTMLVNLEKKYQKKYGVSMKVEATPAMKDTYFAYALDITSCIGCRLCVQACVEENNLSRNPQVQWIRVLEMEDSKGINLEYANHYYNPKTVPRKGHFYMPVACQQCKNPPCTKSCPANATWQEKDGIVVIDYNWCLGCRCCMTACPYGARKYNWTEPSIPKKEINQKTHYLGNRPRYNGVVEKCTFCIQRTRKGKYPSCVEICPVGARKFGNLLDPKSEVRQVLAHKKIFILKQEANTQPNFFYYYG